MKNTQLKVRLVLMLILQYAAWGAYLTSLGRYLGNAGLGPQIKWFFAMQGIVSIFMPTLMGIVADRYIPAQKTLSLCHGLAGLFMLGAGLYGLTAGTGVQFAPLFTLYSISVAFYMPTIAISNSVAYNAMGKNGMDPVKEFPPLRVFGTVGFIASMLATNFIKIGGVAMQDNYTQLFSSGILSLILCAYALTMPACEVNRGESKSLAEAFGLKAFSLFKDGQFAVFFIFSMLLGASLQITNGYANTGYLKAHSHFNLFKNGQCGHPLPYTLGTVSINKPAYIVAGTGNFYCRCTRCKMSDIMTIQEARDHVCQNS